MHTFYYDDDCGFCTWALGHARRICPTITYIPGRANDETQPAIVRNTIATAAVASDGTNFYIGHQAIGHILRTAGTRWYWRFLGRLTFLPITRTVASLIYRQVADNRYRIAEKMGFGACTIRP